MSAVTYIVNIVAIDALLLLRRAFAQVHPRLEFEVEVDSEDRVRVTLTQTDDHGAVEGRIEQTVDLLAPLARESDARATAFVEGCAIAARAKAAAIAGRPAWVDWMTPSDLLPTLLLQATTLIRADEFAHALAEPWGVLARLQTRALCDELAGDFPDAIAALRDDEDLALVDAMFALWSDRHDNARTLKLLQQVSVEGRRHLAPLLIAFLDKTASDEDFRLNAYRLDRKPARNPVCQDVAYRILVRWGVPVGDRVDGWIAARAISRDVVT